MIYIFAGNMRVAQRENGTVAYFHKDHLGSSTVMTDAYGNKVGSNIEYYPFGGQRNPGGTIPTHYRFTDQELDGGVGESNLYNYNARLYDPIIGRFISADTIVPDPNNPQSLNRYAYCLNNPLKYTDPSGHYAGLYGSDDYNPWSTLWWNSYSIIPPLPDISWDFTKWDRTKSWEENMASCISFIPKNFFSLPPGRLVLDRISLFDRSDNAKIYIGILPTVYREMMLGGYGSDGKYFGPCNSEQRAILKKWENDPSIMFDNKMNWSSFESALTNYDDKFLLTHGDTDANLQFGFFKFVNIIDIVSIPSKGNVYGGSCHPQSRFNALAANGLIWTMPTNYIDATVLKENTQLGISCKTIEHWDNIIKNIKR